MADGTFPVTIQNGIHIIELSECIVQNLLPEQIGPEIVYLIDKAQDPRLILSFKDVQYLSSSFLGMLLMVNNSIAHQQGKLLMCNLNRQVQDLFDLTKLTMKFNICTTLDEALSHFD